MTDVAEGSPLDRQGLALLRDPAGCGRALPGDAGLGGGSDMGGFVGQQAQSLRGVRAVAAGAEQHLVAHRHGVSLLAAGRGVRLVVSAHAHSAMDRRQPRRAGVGAHSLPTARPQQGSAPLLRLQHLHWRRVGLWRLRARPSPGLRPLHGR